MGGVLTSPRSKRRSERAVLTVAFVLYAAVTLWTTLHHEAWIDEAEPWLLVRDADLASVFRAAANSGVPLLFPATVWPFARAGAPYLAQQLVNLAFVWGAVLLLFRSRAFPAAVKILFAFSYFAAFEFAAIPRPYGLQMLLTFAMAELWRERQTRPMRLAVVIALLANTTTPGLITAAVAGALLLGERLVTRTFTKRTLASTTVMILGGLAAAAQLWPREGRQHVHQLVSIDTLWYALAGTFFPDGRTEDFVIPAVIVLGLVTYGISRHAVPLLFLWLSGTAILCIYVFIWMGGIRHAGLLLILVMAALWIAHAYGPYRGQRLLMIALSFSLAYSVIPATSAWRDETRFAFSGSREVATFIRRRGLDRHAVIVAPRMLWSSPLVYLPGTKLWYPAANRFGTYTLWERQEYLQSRMPLPELLARAAARFPTRRWVILLDRDLPEPLRPRYHLLFQTQAPIWRAHGESYRIYEPIP